MRARTLALWTAAAVAVLAGLAVHDATRGGYEWTAAHGRYWLGTSFDLWFFAGAGLFIAHALVASGDAERRWISSYRRHFEIGWKQAVQLVLASLFVYLFWGVLWLGAALFRLVEIEAFAELISERWFAIPATTLAFAGALHLTDVRPGMVRGIRTLTLTLFSALLPVMALIAAGFLAALLMIGLQPLWATRWATPILLTAAAALVILVNAAYQDGRADRPPSLFLRLAARAGALGLAPLVAISAYNLSLRVGQHGWTPDRVIAAACILVAACYALGYAVAALRPGRWMAALEVANVATAFAILAVLLALFTPLADPARLSVADQLRRLESDAVAPAQFDFAFLRSEGARYGREALERLKAGGEGPRAAEIAERAGRALAQRDYARPAEPPTAQQRAANITVHPAGAVLPDGFLLQNWTAESQPGQTPRCLIGHEKCDARLVDLDGDDVAEVLLVSRSFGPGTAYRREADGRWRVLGVIGNLHCKGAREAFRSGEVEAVAPRWRELQAGSHRLTIAKNC